VKKIPFIQKLFFHLMSSSSSLAFLSTKLEEGLPGDIDREGMAGALLKNKTSLTPDTRST
jgi:hypothetical protein